MDDLNTKNLELLEELNKELARLADSMHLLFDAAADQAKVITDETINKARQR